MTEKTAPKEEPGLSFRWKLLAGLLLFVCAAIGYRFGFWAFVAALYFAILILALGKPFRRFFKLVYRGVLFVGLFGIPAGWLIDQFLEDRLKNPTMSTILGLTAGLFLGVAVLDTVIEVYSQARLGWITALSPDVDPKASRKVLRQLFLGINYPVLMVSDGKYDTTREGGVGGVLLKLGGPGLMFVNHGNAVVLERAGKFTQVARGGITMLKLYERPRAVVDLRRKQEPLRVDDVLTRDGVNLRVELTLWYQMRRRPPALPKEKAEPQPKAEPENNQPAAAQKKQSRLLAIVNSGVGKLKAPLKRGFAGGNPGQGDGQVGVADADDMAASAAPKPAPDPVDQFNVSDEDLINVVFLVDDWQRAVKTIAGNMLRDIVGERSMDGLIEYDSEAGQLLPRNEIRESLLRRLNHFLEQEKWGVEIVWCDIAAIHMPEGARKRMLEKWEAEWEARIADTRKQATISRGEADAAAASAQEAARARASMQMMTALREAVRDVSPANGEELDRIIKLRLIDALEKMAGEHANGMFLPSTLLDVLATREPLSGRGDGDRRGDGDNRGPSAPKGGAG